MRYQGYTHSFLRFQTIPDHKSTNSTTKHIWLLIEGLETVARTQTHKHLVARESFELSSSIFDMLFTGKVGGGPGSREEGHCHAF